jgi:hypothetical protein
LFSIVRHHSKFLANSAIYTRSSVLRCSPVLALGQLISFGFSKKRQQANSRDAL